jgi:hypothetical protein
MERSWVVLAGLAAADAADAAAEDDVVDAAAVVVVVVVVAVPDERDVSAVVHIVVVFAFDDVVKNRVDWRLSKDVVLAPSWWGLGRPFAEHFQPRELEHF